MVKSMLKFLRIFFPYAKHFQVEDSCSYFSQIK